MEIEIPPITKMREIMVVDPMKKVKCELVPFNKGGDYCEEDDGNTTLLVELNEVKSLTILESGAKVPIATKEVWNTIFNNLGKYHNFGTNLDVFSLPSPTHFRKISCILGKFHSKYLSLILMFGCLCYISERDSFS